MLTREGPPVRRSLSDSSGLVFFYCHAPEGRPVSLPVTHTQLWARTVPLSSPAGIMTAPWGATEGPPPRLPYCRIPAREATREPQPGARIVSPFLISRTAERQHQRAHRGVDRAFDPPVGIRTRRSGASFNVDQCSVPPLFLSVGWPAE
jgi:hypothetical protein